MRAAHGKNIEAILKRAAADPAFFIKLVNDRAGAIKGATLSADERAVLMSADAKQIEMMVRSLKRRDVLKSVARVGLVSAAAAAVAVGVGAALFAPALATLGHRVSPEFKARIALKQIVSAEEMYWVQHGCYLEIDDLVRRGFDSDPRTGIPYEFRVKIDGDSFQAVAIPKPHTDARRAYRVAPPGQVEEFDPGK